MIYVGIGSNLSSSFGDRFKNIELALSFLEENKIKLIKKSSFYETFSYPDKNKPKFINIVASIESTLPALDLMTVLISIEEKLERKRFKKNDPRTCDIDIVDYKNKTLKFKYKNLDFEVPHTQLQNRSFVLLPIQEIAPKWTHPVTKESIKVLIDRLSIEDKNSILKINKP